MATPVTPDGGFVNNLTSAGAQPLTPCLSSTYNFPNKTLSHLLTYPHKSLFCTV